ncbi:3-keto-5-aminohexanoate cleavage protein, partial [Streptomyces sp. NPDC001155]
GLGQVLPRTGHTAHPGLTAELALGADLAGHALLHGEDGGTWPVLRLAGRLGCETRIGLEDTLLLPDGQRASDNAQLVADGLVQYGSWPRSS